MGDFNVEVNDSAIAVLVILTTRKAFLNSQPALSTPINLFALTFFHFILTSKPRNFQHPYVIKTGLSDFHKMTVTVLKTFF